MQNKLFFPNLKKVKGVVTAEGEALTLKTCGARDVESEYTRQTKDGKPPKMSDCVLLNPETGRPFSRSGLNRTLGSLGNRLNIEEVRPHRLRCTFAVDCLLKGLDVHRTAEYLGDTVKQAADILDRDLPATRPAVAVDPPATPDTNLMVEALLADV
jgi:integrase-like protein